VREVFHEELAGLETSLADMTDLVTEAMTQATAALLDNASALAEQVITRREAVEALRAQIEQRAVIITARHQPVAGDLRTVIMSLHVAADLERMGVLATHVAEAARRLAGVAVPAQLYATLREMARVALGMATKARSAIVQHDVDVAMELDHDDDAVDAEHRRLLQLLVAQDWTESTEAAVEITLCGRYYERYADHAVSIGQHVIYLVTGTAER
jgi:phosphate transport system protein